MEDAMITTVICTIAAVVCVGTLKGTSCDGVPFSDLVDVEGLVKAKQGRMLLVDFSKGAVEKNLTGDYSKKLVGKSQCVGIK